MTGIPDAIRKRHREDIEAHMASLTDEQKGAFLDGIILGVYYAGYEKGVIAAEGLAAPK